jgi:hypothetical protein
MADQDLPLPSDFRPVDGCVPEWIDVKEICSDVSRFVGLYSLSNIDAVAINNGKAVFTTADRNGEFRRIFTQVVDQAARELGTVNGPATLVYDCEARRQWVAPLPSAVKFLYSQFADN